MTDKEIDIDFDNLKCEGCDAPIEVMEPYYLKIVNNTDEPEQTVYRFDKLKCLTDWEGGK